MSTATTTASTGLTLDLRHAEPGRVGAGAWGTKAAALVALTALRERGLNRGRDIEVHRAETYLWRYWVIGRPDHYNGVTYLMTADGRWVSGRLTDSPCFCATPCRDGHQTAWCIACRWSTHDDREETVRSAARYHRAHPEQYPDHGTPRRTPTCN